MSDIQRRSFMGFAAGALSTSRAVAATPPSRSPSQASPRRPEGVYYPEDFGAKGDAHFSNGRWLGTDDSAAINLAIQYIENNGGGTIVFRNAYLLDRPQGYTSPIFDEEKKIPFFIKSSGGITFKFLKKSGLFSNGTSDPSLKSSGIAISIQSDSKFIYDFAIDGAHIEGFLIGVACFKNVLAVSKISSLTFRNCGISIYSNVLEQVHFEDIHILHSGCGIVSGGRYVNNVNKIEEWGGYTDKCLFINIRMNGSWNPDTNGRILDQWFDDFSYNSNGDMMPPQSRPGPSPGTANRYRGISGFCIHLMARYARPSNCNLFQLISHANSARSAIHVDDGHASQAQVIYGENVGYLDNHSRTIGVGREWNDPYLGNARRISGLVVGVDVVSCIQAQYCFMEKITDARHIMADDIFSCDLLQHQI